MEKKLQLIQTIWDVMALLSALHFPSETTSLVLVSRIQKRGGTGDNNFGKWKGTFQSEWPKWPDQSLWTPFKAQVPNIPVRPNRNGPFHLWTYRNFRNFWLEWKAPVVYESATLILNPLSSRASGNCLHMLWIWNHVDAKIYTKHFFIQWRNKICVLNYIACSVANISKGVLGTR